MNDNTAKPNAPRKLADEELAVVSGGKGYWDITFETSWNDCYQSDLDEGLTTLSFEDWLLHNVYDEDGAMARTAWIADGRSAYVGFYFENGSLKKYDVRYIS